MMLRLVIMLTSVGSGYETTPILRAIALPITVPNIATDQMFICKLFATPPKVTKVNGER